MENHHTYIKGNQLTNIDNIIEFQKVTNKLIKYK